MWYCIYYYTAMDERQISHVETYPLTNSYIAYYKYTIVYYDMKTRSASYQIEKMLL